MHVKKTGWFSGSLVYAGMALLSSPVNAVLLDLADTPLYLGGLFTPNVFLMMDDSGSMDRDILSRVHWQGRAYDPDFGPDNNNGSNNFMPRQKITDGYIWAFGAEGDGDEEEDGGWGRRYGYIFKNRDDINSSGCNSRNPGIHSSECPPDAGAVNLDWRTRSSALNVIYYNPAVEYKPWSGIDSKGNPFPDANFTQVLSNPQPGTLGYSAPSKNLTGFVYEVWEDDRGFSSVDGQPEGPLRGEHRNPTKERNGIVDLWDKHIRITVNTNTVKVETYVYNDDDITSHGLDPTVTEQLLTGDGKHMELGSWVEGDEGRTIADAKKNIANWYQYYRRRSMAVNGAVAWVLDFHPNFYYGLSAINAKGDLFVEVPDTTDFAAHNNDVLKQLFSNQIKPNTTPLRSGLAHVGKYYKGELTGKVEPIKHACQQNFALLFTDGLWTDENTSPFGNVGDEDLDGKSKTLADVAKYYYDKDLSGLTGDQRMVTYTVAFGLTGALKDSDGDGWPDEDLDGNDPIAKNGNWGRPGVSDSAKVDDLWHAAFNSDGGYISAQTPRDLVTALTESMAGWGDALSSAAPIVLSTGSLNANSLLFQSGFKADDWSGRLNAYRISDGLQTGDDPCQGVPVGAICSIRNPEWQAHEVLNRQDWDREREIVTYNGTKGVKFRWPSDVEELGENDLNRAQVEALNKNINNVVDNRGEERLFFLRGKNDIAGFREREYVLGDIIHSAPVHVTAPNLLYPAHWEDKRTSESMPENAEGVVDYQNWRAQWLQRKRVVYAAANDGMIHAFHAGSYVDGQWNFGDGKELMAYVPGLIHEKLNRLTDPDYTHEYFADSSLTVLEAFFNAEWHTILAGGLGKGGQGIFALDVTDPSNFNEGNGTDDLVLWEFSDSDDADMGYAYHQPVNIVRMHDKKWYAVFGNGYNSTEDDGNKSDTGNAVLFIVDIENGNLVKKIDTGIGPGSDNTPSYPNALATPAPVDTDGDFIIDYIYAGDLYGNMWKFDVTSKFPTDWEIKIKQNTKPAPLFTARDSEGRIQPVTTRPRVGAPVGTQFLAHTLDAANRQDNLMLYFGTGKYIEVSDNLITENEPTQSFYGLWDPMKDNQQIQRSELLEQTIENEIAANGAVWRITSNYNIPGDFAWWENETTPDRRGWFMDMVDPVSDNNRGERIVNDAVLHGDRIIFTTLLPNNPDDPDPCQGGGESWLMVLDRADGSRLAYSPFDVNQDGAFTLDDLIDDQFVSGIKFDNIITTPTTASTPDGEKEFTFTGDDKGNVKILPTPITDDVGRQGWRQIQE